MCSAPFAVNVPLAKTSISQCSLFVYLPAPSVAQPFESSSQPDPDLTRRYALQVWALPAAGVALMK
jgi:hypothetical protein